MKAFKILSLFSILLSLSACNQMGSNFRADNEAVDEYIASLKSGSLEFTNFFHFHNFTENDISALIEYLDDRTVISNFPRNPISSLYLGESEVRIIVMWIIESIRISDPEDHVFERYPSQNPLLYDKEAESFINSYESDAYNVAAKAYKKWGNKVTSYNWNTSRKTDPLKDTNYSWPNY